MSGKIVLQFCHNCFSGSFEKIVYFKELNEVVDGDQVVPTLDHEDICLHFVPRASGYLMLVQWLWGQCQFLAGVVECKYRAVDDHLLDQLERFPLCLCQCSAHVLLQQVVKWVHFSRHTT